MTCRAIIFDLFGTIVDGFAAPAAGYQERFAAALGVPQDFLMQRWRTLSDRRTLGEFQTVEASIEYVCDFIGATVTTEQMMNAVEVRLQLTRDALAPAPDAVFTIARLRSSGYKIGLLSNCSIEVPIVWPETEFAPLFDSTVFSCHERIKKPAAEIYRIACQRLDVAPEACVYVADGENYELSAAAACGLSPILMRPRAEGPRSATRPEASTWRGHAITALTELFELIEAIGAQ